MTSFISSTLIGVNMQQKGIGTEDIRTKEIVKIFVLPNGEKIVIYRGEQ